MATTKKTGIVTNILDVIKGSKLIQFGIMIAIIIIVIRMESFGVPGFEIELHDGNNQVVDEPSEPASFNSDGTYIHDSSVNGQTIFDNF